MSGIIPAERVEHVSKVFAHASGKVDYLVELFREEVDGATQEELFYAATGRLLHQLANLGPGDRTPTELFQDVAQTLFAAVARLAKTTEVADAPAPPRTILDPGQEHRVAIMLPTGRIVDVVMTCETRGDRPQLVATIGAGDVGHVAIRTPETAKWDRP